MKQYTFKLRSTQRGPQHVHIMVFAGFVEPGGTLANCGSFVMNIGEWQAFRALLSLGAKIQPLGANFVPVKVIMENNQGQSITR